MPKKNPKKPPKVHEDLSGFAIKINEFGEIETTFEVEKLNEFLNEKVDDKKLREQHKDTTEEESAPDE
ncbi:MAG: hypothetical protein KF852_09345 [Saprospiraceae bacterium]|nr:hypothetical protein [Saprospiraceae bacterium]